MSTVSLTCSLPKKLVCNWFITWPDRLIRSWWERKVIKFSLSRLEFTWNKSVISFREIDISQTPFVQTCVTFLPFSLVESQLLSLFTINLASCSGHSTTLWLVNFLNKMSLYNLKLLKCLHPNQSDGPRLQRTTICLYLILRRPDQIEPWKLYNHFPSIK